MPNRPAHLSPQDGVAKHVLERLKAAKRSITFMTFSYTEDKISDVMIAKQLSSQRGYDTAAAFLIFFCSVCAQP